METSKFDVADYINTIEDVQAYLNVVLEENDLAALYEAIGTVARSRGMTAISKDTGLSRESLYKALSSDGNPSFATISKVLGTLGLRFAITTSEQLATV